MVNQFPAVQIDTLPCLVNQLIQIKSKHRCTHCLLREENNVNFNSDVEIARALFLQHEKLYLKFFSLPWVDFFLVELQNFLVGSQTHRLIGWTLKSRLMIRKVIIITLIIIITFKWFSEKRSKTFLTKQTIFNLFSDSIFNILNTKTLKQTCKWCIRSRLRLDSKHEVDFETSRDSI